MKKIILYLFCLVFPLQIEAQDIKHVTMGFVQNIDIWKPYNHLNDGSNLDLKRTSNTYSGYIQYTFVNRQYFVLKAGAAFKHISYMVDDRIRSFKLVNYYPGPPNTKIVAANVDFFSSSNNLGLDLTLEWKFATPKLMTTGVMLEGYCFEFYKAEYGNPEVYSVANISQPKPSVRWYGKDNIFHLSNLNGSVFYSYHIINKSWFSTAVKVSAGINTYSAWDQFQRYAWLGIGLEVGFGKPKTAEKILPDNLN